MSIDYPGFSGSVNLSLVKVNGFCALKYIRIEFTPVRFKNGEVRSVTELNIFYPQVGAILKPEV